MIPLFMWSMNWAHPFAPVLSFILFAIAGLTDSLDGFIARKYNQITTFGKFVDPLADKLLVTSALLMFIEQGRMETWIVMLILTREFCITTLRVIAAGQHKIIAADISGKIKTFVQIIGILVLLTPWHTFVLIPALGLSAGDLTGWILAAVTLWSGLVYIVKNRDILHDEKP